MKLVVEHFDQSVVTDAPIVQVTEQPRGATITFTPDEYASMNGGDLMQAILREREITDRAFSNGGN